MWAIALYSPEKAVSSASALRWHFPPNFPNLLLRHFSLSAKPRGHMQKVPCTTTLGQNQRGILSNVQENLLFFPSISPEQCSLQGLPKHLEGQSSMVSPSTQRAVTRPSLLHCSRKTLTQRVPVGALIRTGPFDQSLYF